MDDGFRGTVMWSCDSLLELELAVMNVGVYASFIIYSVSSVEVR